MTDALIIESVKRWLETMVIGLSLCPFAQRELLANRIRFTVTDACNEEQLLLDIQRECDLLANDERIETTLLIHPEALEDFYQYNEFLALTEELLQQTDREGVFQIASFHPRYQFSGTSVEAAENYTNRSPYPILHILREASVSKAVANHPDIEGIPGNNITQMELIGQPALEKQLQGFRT